MEDTPTPLLNSRPLPVRHYGRVVHYDSRQKERFGFIVDLGSWQDEERVQERIYFNPSRVRKIATPIQPLVMFCDGNSVEYLLEKKMYNGEVSYRAYDITGLHEGYLPFHKNVITATPHHVAMKRIAKKDAEKGQAHFEAIQKKHEESENRIKEFIEE